MVALRCAAVAPTTARLAKSTGGDGTCTLHWQAPASNGGDALVLFDIAGSPGSLAQSTTAFGATSASFSGLTNNVTYTFTITARTTAGSSSAITVQCVPFASTQVWSLALCFSSALIRWRAAGSTGGDGGGSGFATYWIVIIVILGATPFCQHCSS